MSHKLTYRLSMMGIVAIIGIVGLITVLAVANGNTHFRKYASANAATIEEDAPPPVGSHPTNKDITLYKLSFGGRVGIDDKRGFDGNWRIKFNEVSRNELDNTMFRLAAIDTLEFTDDCRRTVYLRGLGKLDNSLGWIIEMELAEQIVDGEEIESVRIKLSYPGNDWTYDTADDFSNDVNCPGHTRIDSGKIDLI